MEFAPLFTRVIAIATVLGNILTVLALFTFLFARPFGRRMFALLGEYGVPVAVFLSSGATVGSLLYSEVVGFAPCILCWIQRAFMYPQMLLLLIALWWKRSALVRASLLLSIVGGLVALYNWIKDMLALYTDLTLACPVVPGMPSCDRIYVLEYGYVTIAMFALNIFILLSLVLFAVIRKEGLTR